MSHLYEFHTAAVVKQYSLKTNISIKSHHQIMAQFLYRKKLGVDRFLTFVHQEGILFLAIILN